MCPARHPNEVVLPAGTKRHHDADPAMIPVLFEGEVRGKTRRLVAVGDKAGNFVILDRQTGELVHRASAQQAERPRHTADYERSGSLPESWRRH